MAQILALTGTKTAMSAVTLYSVLGIFILQVCAASAAAAGSAGIGTGVPLPPPTGPYHVGVRKHVIEHYNDADPVAPNNISTSFLATIFYPTASTSCGSDAQAETEPYPYLDPVTAASLGEYFHFPAGALESLTTNMTRNAPFLSAEDEALWMPTLVYGPGGSGPPVECSTILLAELASHGYTVIGLDHTYEQPFVRYPDGTGYYGLPLDVSLTTELVAALYETRLGDLDVLVQKLPALAEEMGDGVPPFNDTHVGVLGLSLGGAAAVGWLYGDGDGDEEGRTGDSATRRRAAINLDGALWGRGAVNDSAADTGSPTMLLGQELHTGESAEFDATWGTFPLWQTGELVRKILVNATLHYDFGDFTFWKTVADSDSNVGAIDGRRQVEILNTLVRAFLDTALLGRDAPPVLRGPDPEVWPELAFWDRDGPVEA